MLPGFEVYGFEGQGVGLRTSVMLTCDSRQKRNSAIDLHPPRNAFQPCVFA